MKNNDYYPSYEELVKSSRKCGSGCPIPNSTKVNKKTCIINLLKYTKKDVYVVCDKFNYMLFNDKKMVTTWQHYSESLNVTVITTTKTSTKTKSIYPHITFLHKEGNTIHNFMIVDKNSYWFEATDREEAIMNFHDKRLTKQLLKLFVQTYKEIMYK